MPVGADKLISYDPPGAIGLVDVESTLLIRFEEVVAATRPQDTLQVCDDFDVHINGPLVMPGVVAAVLGRGRSFNGVTTGLGARDKVSGATLLTRDMSIQVVLSWDAATQAAHQPGVIICRGLGSSSAEYVSYSLQLDVFDAPSFTGLLRWHWQDVAGVDRLSAGVQVVIPPNQFTMLTATRRWASPTSVELAYYVGDQLAGVETSVNGSIGGGTTGALEIGYRTVAGVNGKFYAGIIDELLVVGRELCAEEIEATWLRLTVYQPRGAQLFLEMFDPDFPLNDEPGSDQQLDIRMTGQTLGFAAAQAENLRANFLPQRAYGSTLEQWEEAVAVTPKPAQGIAARRARVVSRFRQKRGISIPGLGDALADLLDCTAADLEYLAFDNTWLDDFTAISPLRWAVTPAACCTAVAGKAHFAPGAGTFTTLTTWLTIASTCSRSSETATYSAERALSKMAMTTPQDGAEAGVWMGERGDGNYILIGLRDVAGVFKIVTETFVNHASVSLVIQATLAGNPAALWLHLYQEAGTTNWRAAWSITSRTTGYTVSPAIAQPGAVRWAGCYFRSTAAIGAAVVDFDDFTLRTPNGSRPTVAYVYRNPALGGAPDIEGANSVLQAIKHGFTQAAVIESKIFRCDIDPCDRVPMGAL